MGDLNKLIAMIKEIGFKPNIDRFQDRLAIQKLVYLLKLSGIDLGYSFSLYARGPYSPDLTRDLYEHEDLLLNLRTNCRLQKKEVEKLDAIFNLSSKLDTSMLEIMSTYLYFAKECNLNEKEALTNLKKIKPFYSDVKIVIGVSRAKQLFLSLTEKDISEIKKELNEWEEIAVEDQKGN